MLLIGKKIVFGLTNFKYAFSKTIPQISKLISEGAEIIPVMSYDAYNKDNEFENVNGFVKQIEEMTFKKIIHRNEELDSINNADLMLICPCSGTTIGKLASGIMDTPVLNYAKKILRNDKNIVLGIATADGLSRECRKHW